MNINSFNATNTSVNTFQKNMGLMNRVKGADEKKNEDYSKAIDLHYKANRTMEDAYAEAAIRRENPALDRALYEADKAEMFNDSNKAKNLMKKIARGEELTPEERAYMEENYPDMVRQAEQAKQQAEQMADQIKNASSDTEKNAVVMEAYTLVQNTAEVDSEYAEVLGESIKKMLSDTSDSNSSTSTSTNMYNSNSEAVKNSMVKSLFDTRS